LEEPLETHSYLDSVIQAKLEGKLPETEEAAVEHGYPADFVYGICSTADLAGVHCGFLAADLYFGAPGVWVDD
jgi:hypothetical protein